MIHLRGRPRTLEGLFPISRRPRNGLQWSWHFRYWLALPGTTRPQPRECRRAWRMYQPSVMLPSGRREVARTDRRARRLASALSRRTCRAARHLSSRRSAASGRVRRGLCTRLDRWHRDDFVRERAVRAGARQPGQSRSSEDRASRRRSARREGGDRARCRGHSVWSGIGTSMATGR